MFKLPLEPLRTTVLPSTSQPPLFIKIMNTQTISQINQFLPSFLCSVSLIYSAILLFVFSSSAILLCVPFHSAHLLPFLPCILFCIPPYCFPHFLLRTANETQSFSSSFIHTGTTFQLPSSLGKMMTTVQPTEMPTDQQLMCDHESVLLIDL
jgi:hypothetical protein